MNILSSASYTTSQNLSYGPWILGSTCLHVLHEMNRELVILAHQISNFKVDGTLLSKSGSHLLHTSQLNICRIEARTSIFSGCSRITYERSPDVVPSCIFVCNAANVRYILGDGGDLFWICFSKIFNGSERQKIHCSQT